MSHIEEYLENNRTPARRANITSVWNTYHEANRSARVYRSGRIRTNRRISNNYTADLVAETEENQHKEVLEEVANTQWQVYKCSPLWNVKWKEREPEEASGENVDLPPIYTDNILRMAERNVEKEYDEQELKRVARLITSYVATHSVSGEECPYRVEVTTMKGMKGVRTDSHALSVSVFTTMMEEEKRIFLGIICGVETAQLNLRSEDCVNLPLFLTVGNADTTQRVIYGLEKYFDCQISSLFLPQLELRWMAAMWAGLGSSQQEDTELPVGKKKPPSKSRNEELKLSYSVPLDSTQEAGQKQKIRHITCAFPMADVKKIYKVVHPNEDSEFTDEAMDKFHQILGALVKEETRIDLDKMELIQISLPFLKAERSGKVRIESCELLKVVLRYLTELCQGDMFQVDPTLSVQTRESCLMDWV